MREDKSKIFILTCIRDDQGIYLEALRLSEPQAVSTEPFQFVGRWELDI